MESISQAPSNKELNFKIKFNDETYSDQPLKVVNHSDLTFQEFCAIVENVYGLSHGAVTSITYVDEDLDEVAVGSEEEFKQLLKSADKWRQHNQFCLLNIVTQMDSSEEFENVEPISSVAGSDITDLGSVQLEVLNKVNDMNKKLEPLLNAQSDREPPVWFKQYMTQFKGEILQEVKGLIHKQQNVQEMPHKSKPKHHSNPMTNTTSSGDTHRRIEKLLRKERRLQQKMSRKTDLAKLLKLNTRLRHVNHEKNLLISGLSEEERAMWKLSVQQGSGGISGNGGSGSVKGVMNQFDAKEMAKRSECVKVKPGATFEYTWSIINCGLLPWTEETQLNLMSCSQGLEPVVSSVLCPRLKSCEAGQISMEFRAPRSNGIYSSVWNLAHRGMQFGQCLSCVVAVDGREQGQSSGVAAPGLKQNKSQEFISSEDDESSCDDHSEDFVVIPSSFQDKAHLLSTCSDGSIEILNHTPGTATPLDRTPRKNWEFSQNGPGVYRNQDGEIIYPPNLEHERQSIYPDLTKEKLNLTQETESIYTNPPQERASLTRERETTHSNPPRERETVYSTPTIERETICQEENVVSAPIRLEKGNIIVVDEQGKCTLVNQKATSSSNPQNNQTSNSTYNSKIFNVLNLHKNAREDTGANDPNPELSLHELICREASKAAEMAAKEAVKAAASAATAAGVAMNLTPDAPSARTANTSQENPRVHVHTTVWGNGTHAASTSNSSHTYTSSNSSSASAHATRTDNSGIHATMNGNNGTHASTYATSNGNNGTDTTNCGTHASDNSNNTHTHTHSNTELPAINVNDIVNMCSAQAASTAQNIISGLLANPNGINGLGNLTNQVIGGFMNMSGTPGTEANVVNDISNLTHQVVGGFMNMSGGTSEANTQTNNQAHAQTNTQTEINTQTHAQTNTPAPNAFVFSPPQSVTQILQNLMLATTNRTTGLRTNVERSTAERDTAPPSTNASHVYSRVPQARSSHRNSGNIFLNYPQARNMHAKARAPYVKASNHSETTSTRRSGKSHAARDQGNSRGMDLSSMLSVLVSSDNSDSGHLSNNSKIKKKAVRKSIKLERNYMRNNKVVYPRKKESAESSRIDPSIWMDLTRRIQDLNATGSGSQTEAAAPAPETQCPNKNIWTLRTNPPQPTRSLSAETFLNPVSFSNFPPVPSEPPPKSKASSKTPNGNAASGNATSGNAAGMNTSRGNRASGNAAIMRRDAARAESNVKIQSTSSKTYRGNQEATAAAESQADTPNMSEMMNQLLEMGYMDKQMNRKTLEECGHNVDAAIHKLAALYSPISAQASVPSSTQNSTTASRDVQKSEFEVELENMMSHLVDMGFDNIAENMQVLSDNNFSLADAAFALVAAREKEEEEKERAARPGCTGH